MSTRRGFWAGYAAWWQRNGYWVWAIVAVLDVWAGGIQSGGWRWFFLAYAMVAAFLAGWWWRERTAHRRVMRLAEADEWQTAIRGAYGRGDAA